MEGMLECSNCSNVVAVDLERKLEQAGNKLGIIQVDMVLLSY